MGFEGVIRRDYEKEMVNLVISIGRSIQMYSVVRKINCRERRTIFTITRI